MNQYTRNLKHKIFSAFLRCFVIVKILLVPFLFVALLGYAQDTLSIHGAVAKGKTKPYKYVSPTTQTKQKKLLKTGLWSYYDEDGVLQKTESYTIADGTSFLNGKQIFYNAEGNPILIRYFNHYKITQEEPLLPYVILQGKEVIDIRKFQDSVYIYHPVPKDTTWQIFNNILRINLIEDPNAPNKLAIYKHFEDSIGNPQLIRRGSFSYLHPQNAIANPSFENHPTTEISVSSFDNQVTSWYPASPTPDFDISPQVAHSGEAFVGIRIYSKHRDIEYVQNKLNYTLKKDQKYCFSAYIKLAPSSVPTDAFGVFFSEKAITFKKIENTTYKADLLLDKEFLTYKSEWMLLQCNYTANGTESWMTIGSFKPVDEVNLMPVPGAPDESYYYIDDVSLVPIATNAECPCNLDGKNPPHYADNIQPTIPTDQDLDEALMQLNIGDKLVLENIFFKIDKYELLPESLKTLNRLMQALEKYPTIKIEISGHTSSTGDYDHNVSLSKNRANAVAQYLEERGIDKRRLTIAGYGPDLPIASNDTEVNRQMNRRVELKVLAK